MGSSPADLPDPLDLSAELPPRATDDLLSQLAGDQIDRMMSGAPRRPIAGGAPGDPVEQLTEQLDNFFEDLRQREGPIAPPPTREMPEAFEDDEDDLSPTQEELNSLHGVDSAAPRSLFPPRAIAVPEPGYLAPLNWLSDPVAALSRPARIAVGVTAILSFLAGCAALTYVLVIRHS